MSASIAARALSGTIINAAIHALDGLGELTVDPLDKLSHARTVLEGGSDHWAAILVIASIAVAVGVIIEFLADVLELVEDVKEKRPIKFRTQLLFLASFIVISGVVVEFIAEDRGAKCETKLRGNNAAAQGVLEKRERDATQAAVDLANKFGGLQGFVQQQERQIEAQMGEFRTFTAKAKRETAATIAELNMDRANLDNARAEALAAAASAETALAETRKEHEGRTLSAKQRADLIREIRGTIPSVLMRWVENDPDSYEYAKIIGDTISKAGVTIEGYNPWGFTGILTPRRGDPEVIILEWGDGSVEPGNRVAGAFRGARIPVSVDHEDWVGGKPRDRDWRVDILVTPRQPAIPSEGP